MKLYDVRCEGRIVLPAVELETALKYYNNVEPEYKHLYVVTSVDRK